MRNKSINVHLGIGQGAEPWKRMTRVVRKALWVRILHRLRDNLASNLYGKTFNAVPDRAAEILNYGK